MRLDKLFRPALLLLVIASVSITTIAQENACPIVVENALAATDRVCAETGRNQACYGHVSITAQPRFETPDFRFELAGDIVDVSNLQRISLSTLDAESGAWGVALMRLQADLPDTLPGQNVTMLMFGDTTITNAVQPERFVDVIVESGGEVNLYAGASNQSAVIGTLNNGQGLLANGRTANDRWIRVQRLDGTEGWVTANTITTFGDLNLLRVVNPRGAIDGAMQAFYLRTGVGTPVCNELPQNGLLVQTPEGVQTVTLSINDVRVEMGSTLFFQAEASKELAVNVLEGSALVTVRNVSQPAVAGGRVTVPIDEAYRPVAPPNEFEAYESDSLETLPTEQLDRPVEVDEPASEAEVMLLETYEPYFELVAVDEYDTLIDRMTTLMPADSNFVLDEATVVQLVNETDPRFELADDVRLLELDEETRDNFILEVNRQLDNNLTFTDDLIPMESLTTVDQLNVDGVDDNVLQIETVEDVGQGTVDLTIVNPNVELEVEALDTRGATTIDPNLNTGAVEYTPRLPDPNVDGYEEPTEIDVVPVDQFDSTGVVTIDPAVLEPLNNVDAIIQPEFEEDIGVATLREDYTAVEPVDTGQATLELELADDLTQVDVEQIDELTTVETLDNADVQLDEVTVDELTIDEIDMTELQFDLVEP